MPDRPAAWTALGNALHEAFYNWELAKRDYSLPQILQDFGEIFDREIEKYKAKQPDYGMWFKSPRTKLVVTDIDNYRKRGLEGDVPNYYNYCVNSDWKILLLPDGFPALELEFELTLGEILVVGGIDKILEWPDGRLTIEDIKTGRLEVEDRRQLGLYSFAANQTLGLDRDVRWGRYFFTKPILNRYSEWFDLSRYDSTYLSQSYSRLSAGLEQGVWLANPGDHCKLCSVRDWCSELGHLQPPVASADGSRYVPRKRVHPMWRV